jgi:hypothetical protein
MVSRGGIGVGSCIAVVLVVACRATNLAPYPGAGVFAGTAVGVTALNRAATGDCWAACPSGRHCDRASGMCVPTPCGGACRADWICVDGQCAPPRTAEKIPVPVTDAGPDS